jgi:hypothetical protein
MDGAEIVEHTIKGMVKGGMTPYDIFLGIHHAMTHGDLIEENGFNISDADLKMFYSHLDPICQLMEEISEE